jgi:folate-dependent phosphoribosylglycinamide formyltransferase PurN
MFIKQLRIRKETGITIHYKMRNYDEGGVISKRNNGFGNGYSRCDCRNT